MIAKAGGKYENSSDSRKSVRAWARHVAHGKIHPRNYPTGHDHLRVDVVVFILGRAYRCVYWPGRLDLGACGWYPVGSTSTGDDTNTACFWYRQIIRKENECDEPHPVQRFA